ncbi:MAG: hypothetical protein OEX01_08730, partial [Candidatus Bathyarchaeota archaeon]|nr:hypothetical protein [Candidatus Bathyarchaeota archaeon]
MVISPKVRQAVECYSGKRMIYKALAKRVESIIREILESEKINYHSIVYRAKSVESYQKKATIAKYREPRLEIMDMAGIRVITYTDSDAKKVYEIIKGIFEIQPEHSIDKSKELGIDRVGYRSIHCIGTLGKERLSLPENKIFKDMCFEVQIRTILQHAWAEFEHDRNYKFRGVLPNGMKRRFSILAGNLELVDKEFDSLSESIDAYAMEIGRKTELGDLDVAINSTSLTEYMKWKFKPLIDKRLVIPELTRDAETISEINNMGIKTLQGLEQIIPKDFIEIRNNTIPENSVGWSNFTSLIIDLLIIHNADAYFEKAWQMHWHGLAESDVKLYTHYGV